MFDRLAFRYDLFNRLASAGIDRSWRRALIGELLSRVGRDPLILDLGTGTGDLPHGANARSRQPLRWIGADLSHAMLCGADRKLSASRKSAAWIQASAAAIPLADASVDAVINAFVLRNVKRILPESLSEIRRVLKPGGSALFLEMYAPRIMPLRFLHGLYLRTVLPAIGRGVFGRSWSGAYLADTILGFGTPEQFSDVLAQAGFSDVKMRKMTFGAAVLHCAKKNL